MLSPTRCFIVTLAVVSVLAGVARASILQAGSDNVRTMAGILATLNHFPSDEQKATLQAITTSESATANEKALADALLGVQHSAAADDKAQLDAIVNDSDATEGEKMLAGVIAGLNHTPSAEEKAALTKLAAGN